MASQEQFQQLMDAYRAYAQAANGEPKVAAEGKIATLEQNIIDSAMESQPKADLLGRYLNQALKAQDAPGGLATTIEGRAHGKFSNLMRNALGVTDQATPDLKGAVAKLKEADLPAPPVEVAAAAAPLSPEPSEVAPVVAAEQAATPPVVPRAGSSAESQVASAANNSAADALRQELAQAKEEIARTKTESDGHRERASALSAKLVAAEAANRKLAEEVSALRSAAPAAAAAPQVPVQPAATAAVDPADVQAVSAPATADNKVDRNLNAAQRFHGSLVALQQKAADLKKENPARAEAVDAAVQHMKASPVFGGAHAYLKGSGNTVMDRMQAAKPIESPNDHQKAGIDLANGFINDYNNEREGKGSFPAFDTAKIGPEVEKRVDASLGSIKPVDKAAAPTQSPGIVPVTPKGLDAIRSVYNAPEALFKAATNPALTAPVANANKVAGDAILRSPQYKEAVDHLAGLPVEKGGISTADAEKAMARQQRATAAYEKNPQAFKAMQEAPGGDMGVSLAEKVLKNYDEAVGTVAEKAEDKAADATPLNAAQETAIRKSIAEQANRVAAMVDGKRVAAKELGLKGEKEAASIRALGGDAKDGTIFRSTHAVEFAGRATKIIKDITSDGIQAGDDTRVNEQIKSLIGAMKDGVADKDEEVGTNLKGEKAEKYNAARDLAKDILNGKVSGGKEERPVGAPAPQNAKERSNKDVQVGG